MSELHKVSGDIDRINVFKDRVVFTLNGLYSGMFFECHSPSISLLLTKEGDSVEFEVSLVCDAGDKYTIIHKFNNKKLNSYHIASPEDFSNVFNLS